MRNFWRTIIQAFERTPVVGGLALCSFKDHCAAIKDFCYALIFSTITFWLSAIVLMAFQFNSEKSYFSLLASTISNGELFIFSVGFLGPALLITFEDPNGAKKFPGKVWHALAFLVLGCISAAFFALMKITSNPEIPSKILNQSFLFKASVTLALLCGCLRYLSIVYRKFTLRPDDIIKEKEKNFSDEFARRHGVQTQ